MIRVHDILAGTGGQMSGKISRNDLLDHVVQDSRLVTEGDLFVAIKGENTDGHRFVPDALEHGARAVMVDQAWYQQYDLGDLPVIVVPDTLAALQSLATYWRSLFDVQVVGITGSIGKSSTKEVVSAVLAQRFQVTRSQKSYNNEIGLPLSVLEITPDSEVVVLEMGGAYAFGEIAELAKIARPTIGIVTNVSHSHLGRMGTLEAIAETKAELIDSLPEDGIAILNIDDERVRRMAERAKCRVVFYGLDDAADYHVTDLTSSGMEGISFILHHDETHSHVSVPLMGRHSVHMALAGIAVGTEMGLSLADILRGFQTPDIQLRLVLVPATNGATILDDSYNANPASGLAALSLLDELPGNRKVAVLGDMMELGSYEEEGHRMVGGRAAQVVDALYTIGPRARIIAAQAVQLNPRLKVETFDDKATLVDVLRRDLRQGDLVLVKGSRSLGLESIVSDLRTDADGEAG
jgi:UDP-N-acetylmuramoyl-tripeptide--D-alanyl-D-alanine ligase